MMFIISYDVLLLMNHTEKQLKIYDTVTLVFETVTQLYCSKNDCKDEMNVKSIYILLNFVRSVKCVQE